MTEPVAKRADQLVVGDLVPDEFLPYRFNKGPAEVVFVAVEPGDASGFRGEAHTFFAFRYPNGQHESTTVRAEAVLMVWPAPDPLGHGYSRADDAETTQPIAERPLVVEGGAWAIPVAGGLAEIDPPEGFASESLTWSLFGLDAGPEGQHADGCAWPQVRCIGHESRA